MGLSSIYASCGNQGCVFVGVRVRSRGRVRARGRGRGRGHTYVVLARGYALPRPRVGIVYK